MTDISPQSWAAPEAPSGPFGGRAPILLAVAERAEQRRLTVLLRIILLIPQWVALWALGIAAEVIAVIGWFGALFTGRLPRSRRPTCPDTCIGRSGLARIRCC